MMGRGQRESPRTSYAGMERRFERTSTSSSSKTPPGRSVRATSARKSKFGLSKKFENAPPKRQWMLESERARDKVSALLDER